MEQQEHLVKDSLAVMVQVVDLLGWAAVAVVLAL
jgi:hypothetical protein